ncbi:MAG: hypothetical protein ABEN55_10550 [Bradymonadaceae bacterium]
MSEQSADDLLERLRQTGEELPFELRETILEADSSGVDTDDLVAGLVEVLRDPSLAPSGPREASPASHAAMLLGLVEADEAIEPLLDTIEEESQPSYLATTAAQALQRMSDRGQSRLIERYESVDSADIERRLARGAAQLAPHADERVLEILVRELEGEDDPGEGSSLLSDISMVAATIEVDEPEEYTDRISEWYEETAGDAPDVVKKMVDVQYAQAREALESDPPEEDGAFQI